MSRRLRILIAAGVPLLAAAVYLLRAQICAFSAHFPPCWFHAVTGLYCPGCGNTRSVRAMLRFDLPLALRNNVTMPFLALLLLLLYVETVSALIRKDGKALRLLPRSGCVWGTVIGLFLVYFVVRNLIPAIAPVS